MRNDASLIYQECRHDNILLLSYSIVGLSIPVTLMRNSETNKIVDYKEADVSIHSGYRTDEVFECADCGMRFDRGSLVDSDG
jgi:hypothetical protein